MTDIEILVRIAVGKTLGTTGRGRRVRVAAGLSQATMGVAVGATGSQIQLWEKCNSYPNSAKALRWLETVEALEAAGFGVEDGSAVDVSSSAEA